jgi:hypothetical protein
MRQILTLVRFYNHIRLEKRAFQCSLIGQR